MAVELLRSLGDDLAIVNAARVSCAKHSTWTVDDDGERCVRRLAEKDAGLINYLMRERHGTPFEIRREAEEVERLAREIVPVAFAAFDEHGRAAP